MAFVAFFLLAVSSGQRGGLGFFDNLVLAVPGVLAAAAALAAGVLGALALRRGDRAVVVFAAVVVGALMAVWVFLELAFPH